ncbi:MAG: Smr/MutS family protein [Wolbachia endosymbiont of Fragariocoptes setiger]|nr:Smr/MutS family protein [Wolbachia endosymbiont of Fragariocoptes setiger]
MLNDDWQKNVKPIKSKKNALNNNVDFKIKIKQKDFTSDCSNKQLKINRGKYFINDTLDLHGYNIEDAYNKLIDFIIKSYKVGNRCILVITGYGNAKNKIGMIRDHLYEWLDNIRIKNIILHYQQAKREDGGRGAFYILLRRNRSISLQDNILIKSI